MIQAVRSELLKLRTTRLWWGMAIAVVLVSAAFAALFGVVAALVFLVTSVVALVREVDALDGIMGRAADAAGIQWRTLNASKGPAVRATRDEGLTVVPVCPYVTKWLTKHTDHGATVAQPTPDDLAAIPQ